MNIKKRFNFLYLVAIFILIVIIPIISDLKVKNSHYKIYISKTNYIESIQSSYFINSNNFDENSLNISIIMNINSNSSFLNYSSIYKITQLTQIRTSNFLQEISFNINFYQNTQILIILVPISCIILTSVISAKIKEILSEKYENSANINAKLLQIKDIEDSIYLTIKNNPGIHFKELCRKLERENGVIQYHLRILEFKRNLIKSYNDGGFTRYFINNKTGRNKDFCNFVSILQHKTIFKIINLLFQEKQPISRNELAQKLNLTPQCISYFVKQINSLGIINILNKGKLKVYSLEPEFEKFFKELFII